MLIEPMTFFSKKYFLIAGGFVIFLVVLFTLVGFTRQPNVTSMKNFGSAGNNPPIGSNATLPNKNSNPSCQMEKPNSATPPNKDEIISKLKEQLDKGCLSEDEYNKIVSQIQSLPSR